MKDIPLACWSFMTSQDKNGLNPRPKTLKLKARWMTLWGFYLLEQTWTSSAKQEGNNDTNSLHQDYGMLNGMQHDHTDGTPNHEMQRALISGGGLLDRL